VGAGRLPRVWLTASDTAKSLLRRHRPCDDLDLPIFALLLQISSAQQGSNEQALDDGLTKLSGFTLIDDRTSGLCRSRANRWFNDGASRGLSRPRAFCIVAFNYEAMSRAQFSDWSHPSGPTSIPGPQITVAERYRRLIVYSQALCSTCPTFTPSSPISTRAFSTSSSNQDSWVLMSSHFSRSGPVRAARQRIKRHTRSESEYQNV